jgi:hypothetical protein
VEGHGITYCDTKEGCRNAIDGLPNLNGLSRATPQMQENGQDFFYAAGEALVGNIYIMERQADNSLVLTDTVKVGELSLSFTGSPSSNNSPFCVTTAANAELLTIGFLGYAMDNLHVEPDGTLYAASKSKRINTSIDAWPFDSPAFPYPPSWLQFGKDPENVLNPSSVHKISVNAGAFFGDKYQIEKVRKREYPA